MSLSWPLRRADVPRGAFGKIVLNEARLVWRLPVALIGALALSLMLLVIFGTVHSTLKSLKALGGHSYFYVYFPIFVALVIAGIALLSMPGPLASYRERGILRRLSTTPVPPTWVLAAQIIVNVTLEALALVIFLAVSFAVFAVGAPKTLAGFLLAVVLCIAAVFAIGLCIAAVAPSERIGAAAGTVMFAFLMFFAGLWIPRVLMPAALRDISELTPLGAAVEAIQDSLYRGFPPIAPLLIMAAYAAIFGFLANRFFRWD
jgi:ABC-2 type transport system permease protein